MEFVVRVDGLYCQEATYARGAFGVVFLRQCGKPRVGPEVAQKTHAAVFQGLPLRVVPNPHLALRAAAEGLAPDDCLCATGSIYLAGIARRVLREALAPREIAAVRDLPEEPLVGS